MYQQTEIAQKQPTQYGLIREKIHHQVPKTVEHTQKRFPVAPVMETKQEQEPISWEKRIEKEQLMRQIKDLVGQVQCMLSGHEEQYVKTQQEELLRQIREIQSQIQDLTFEKSEQRPYGWEKKTEETVRKICELPTKIQDMMYGEQRKHQAPFAREHKKMETIPVEILGERQQVKCEQWGKQVIGEKRRQMIEKLIEQTRILEDVLAEQQYETVYQMPRIEQLHFHLERELFEQLKKRFAELEEQFFVYGYEQEVEQKQRKMFVLLNKQLKQIEEIIYPMTTFEVRMKNHKEQCQQALEKVIGLRGLLQEIVYLTFPEKTEQRHEIETPYTYEPFSKFYNLINLPLFYDEEEIFGRQTKQQETENIVALRKELEEIKNVKRDLEMRLFETDKKVEQFKRQIELLEKFPTKYEQQQPRQQQIRSESVQYTKPEDELIKICLKPNQQSQTYTTVEPKCEMIKSRGLMGKFEQQKQQPNKYF